MNQSQFVTINNFIDFGKKATPYATILLGAKIILNTLDNSGHDFAKVKLVDSAKAIHGQKLAVIFCMIILLIISFFIK